jgi:hypothetical protein
MPIYYDLIGGQRKSFRIAGAVPSPEELQQIEAIRRQHEPVAALPPADSGQNYLQDIGSALKGGVGGLQEGLGWLSGSEGMETAGREKRASAASEMSLESKRARQEGIFGGGGLRALGLGVAESVPQFAATIPAMAAGSALLPGTAAGAVGALAIRVAPRVAKFLTGGFTREAVGRSVIGALSGSTVEGMISAGMNASETQQTIITLAREQPDLFSKSEIGQRYLKIHNGDLPLAALGAAKEIANKVALATGVTTGALSLPAAGFEASVLRGAGRTIAGRAMKGAGLEAATEAGQSGTEQLYQNIGQKTVDESIPYSRGVGRAISEGAAIGGVLGGGFGAVGGVPADVLRKDFTKRASDAQEAYNDLRRYREEQAASGNQERRDAPLAHRARFQEQPYPPEALPDGPGTPLASTSGAATGQQVPVQRFQGIPEDVRYAEEVTTSGTATGKLEPQTRAAASDVQFSREENSSGIATGKLEPVIKITAPDVGFNHDIKAPLEVNSVGEATGRFIEPINKAVLDVDFGSIEKRTDEVQPPIPLPISKDDPARKGPALEQEPVNIQDLFETGRSNFDISRSTGIPLPQVKEIRDQWDRARITPKKALAGGIQGFGTREDRDFNTWAFDMGQSIRHHMDSMGLRDVALTLGRNIEGAGDAAAAYYPYKKAIEFGLSNHYHSGMSDDQIREDLIGYADHEGIHALRDMGTFNQSEWNALVKYATRKKFIDPNTGIERKFTYSEIASSYYEPHYRAHLEKTYPQWTPEEMESALNDMILEEAVAEVYRVWAKDNSKVPGYVGSLMRRIVEFFKRFSRALFETNAESVFREIRSGAQAKKKPKRPALSVETSYKYSLFDPKKDFHSKLALELMNVKAQEIRPQELRNFLKNRGVKDEEIKFSGLEKMMELGAPINVRAAISKLALDPFVLEDWYKGDEIGPLTRYHNWTLPGGFNYKEFLVKLHPSITPFIYKEPHWPGADNVMAHIRLQEFPELGYKENPETGMWEAVGDRDKNSFMFVEELQSVMHQRGREEGYGVGSDPRRVAAAKEEFKIAVSKYVTAVEAKMDLLDYEGIEEPHHFHDLINDIRGHITSDLEPPEVKHRATALSYFVRDSTARVELEPLFSDIDRSYMAWNVHSIHLAVPDAPFKDDWLAPTLKLLFKYTASQNKNRVFFSSGELQSDRWGETENVESLYHISKYSNTIIRETKDGQQTRFNSIDQIPQDHLRQIDERRIDMYGERNDIEGTLRNHVISVHTTVYDKGKLELYNRIVPQEARKVLRLAGVEPRLILTTIGEKNEERLGTFDLRNLSSTEDEGYNVMGFEFSDEDLQKLRDTSFRYYALPPGGNLPPPGARTPPPQGAQDRTYQVEYAAAQRMIYDNVFQNVNSVARKLGRKRRGDLVSRKAFDTAVFLLQDNKIEIAKLIDFTNKNGGNITDLNDVYLAFDLLSGATSSEVEQNFRTLYRPWTDAIKSVGYTDQEVVALRTVNAASDKYLRNFQDKDPAYKDFAMTGLYMLAMHAKERNQFLRYESRNMQNIIDSGSGITDVEAAEIINWFNNSPRYQVLRNAAQLGWDLIKNTNDKRVQYGLSPDFANMPTPQKFIDAGLPNGFQYYVPLRGWLDEDIDEHEDMEQFSRMWGMSIWGREDPSPVGRDSLAGEIIESIVQQNIASITRGRKNEVLKTMARFIEEYNLLPPNVNPSNKMRILTRAPKELRVVGDEIRWMSDPHYKSLPNILIAKDGDKDIIMEIDDARIMRAFKGNGGHSSQHLNALLRKIAAPTIWIGRLATSFNPEFLVSNLARDIAQAMGNIKQYNDVNSADILKTVKTAIAAMGLDAAGGNLSQRQQQVLDLYKELRTLGGTTRDYGYSGYQQVVDKVKDEFETKVSDLPVLKQLDWLKNKVEVANNIFENATRVAVYEALLNAVDANGNPAYTKLQASQAGKNVSINFDRGGEWRTGINALYLFYNASLQGTFSLLQAFARSPKVRRIVAGTAALGLVMDIMNRLLSDDDDDGNNIYEKIPDWVKQHNLIVMIPGSKEYIKWPLPYGYSAIFNAGRNLSAVMAGEKTPFDGASSAVLNIFENFNPMGGAQTFLNWVSPTVADPVIDLYTNRSYSDTPIVPEKGAFGPQIPESQLYWNRTSGMFTWPADLLHEISGGTDVMPGAIELSPNQFEYIVEYIFSGLGKFLLRTYETTTSIPGLITGEYDFPEDVAFNDIPFIRRVFGNVSEREDITKYIQTRDKLLMLDREMSDAREKGDFDRLRNAFHKYGRSLTEISRFKSINNERNRILRQVKEINDNPRIPEGAKKSMLKALNRRSEELLRLGNAISGTQ